MSILVGEGIILKQNTTTQSIIHFTGRSTQAFHTVLYVFGCFLMQNVFTPLARDYYLVFTEKACDSDIQWNEGTRVIQIFGMWG